MGCQDSSSCDTHSHSHSAGSCSCGCQCGCHSCTCSCSKTCCGSEFTAQKMLELADRAWVEVLKDLIKEDILANNPKIKDLAKVVSDANGQRWHLKIQESRAKAAFEDKFNSIM